MLKTSFKLLLFTLLAWPVLISLAEGSPPFQGIVNADNINIRSDSTTGSAVICSVNKDDRIEVISKSYDWYKVKLPKEAPSFIKKSMVQLLSENAAKVSFNRVNIRLEPSTSSPIVGKANKEDIVGILEDAGSWYKIMPVQDSTGWIHKKFVDEAPADIAQPEPPEEETALSSQTEEEGKEAETEEKEAEEYKDPKAETMVFEGIVKPYGMVFGRKATHKLITTGDQVILLKADKKTLNKLNYRKVKIQGNIIGYGAKQYPILQVTQADILE